MGALKPGIDYLVNRFNVKEIYTAYYVTNCVARNLYASVGFCETGERVGNEIGMKLTIGNCIESNCGKWLLCIAERNNEKYE